MYIFESIAETIAQQVRETLRSPQYGHQAQVEVAKGYGPCRACLHTFREGSEERILFTYNPSLRPGAIAQPGPVFIHKEVCERSHATELPEEIRSLPLFVEAFGADPWVIARQPVQGSDVEAALDAVFAQPGIVYAHLRNAEAGCFIATVEKTRS